MEQQISWKLKLTILLVSSLTIMSIITISPSLPEMTLAFAGVPNSDFLVKMILTIPALFIAISAPIAGVFIDKFGRLKPLTFALILYAVAGTAGFWLEDIYLILASRALLGVAVGVSMTIVITLIADYFQGAERQKFVGIQVAFMSAGGILFLGLGGALADINWRCPFLLYIISLLVLPMVLLYLHEPEIKKQESIIESKLKSPSIIWILFVNVMLLWVFFFLVPVQLPFYLKEIGVQKNALIGIAIAMGTMFSAVSSFQYSKIKDKLSFTHIYVIGYTLMAIGYAIVAYSTSYELVLVAMAISGLGIGIMIPNTNMWVMKIAPPEIRGREIGRLTTFWFMGQFLSPILLFPIVNASSIATTFLFVAGCMVILAIGFIFMSSKMK